MMASGSRARRYAAARPIAAAVPRPSGSPRMFSAGTRGSCSATAARCPAFVTTIVRSGGINGWRRSRASCSMVAEPVDPETASAGPPALAARAASPSRPPLSPRKDGHSPSWNLVRWLFLRRLYPLPWYSLCTHSIERRICWMEDSDERFEPGALAGAAGRLSHDSQRRSHRVLGWQRAPGSPVLSEQLWLRHRRLPPETERRDRASYALRQGELTLVFTSGLGPGERDRSARRQARRRGSGHRAGSRRRR